MMYFLLICISLSQVTVPAAVDPSTGYSTELTFVDPGVVNTDQGSYTVFEGVPFLVNRCVRHSLFIFPFPLESSRNFTSQLHLTCRQL